MIQIYGHSFPLRCLIESHNITPPQWLPTVPGSEHYHALTVPFSSCLKPPSALRTGEIAFPGPSSAAFGKSVLLSGILLIGLKV